MRPYNELKDLEQVHLEDSFVLGATILPGTVELRLDVALRNEHPDYRQPRSGESSCFRRGILRFSDVQHVHWGMPTTRPAIDATGEADYGGVDSYLFDDHLHHIRGEIGELAIACAPTAVSLELDSETD